MSKYLKKADPNHMITVGEEGFYTKGSTGELVNPGTGWASLTGQDFIANHASPAIDFAAAHIWPDNWEVGDYLGCLMCNFETQHESPALFATVTLTGRSREHHLLLVSFAVLACGYLLCSPAVALLLAALWCIIPVSVSLHICSQIACSSLLKNSSSTLLLASFPCGQCT